MCFPAAAASSIKGLPASATLAPALAILVVIFTPPAATSTGPGANVVARLTVASAASLPRAIAP